jgi:RND family efflux transporter MFP subunit
MSSVRRLVCCSVLVALAASGCQRPNQFVAPPPPEVDAAYPTVGMVSDYLEFTGSTRPVAEVEIRSRVTGKLRQVLFVDGQDVKKGDELFIIEPETFLARQAEAAANLARAEAALKLAEDRLARRQPLATGSARTLSGEEYSVAVSEVATARAERDSAAAALRISDIDVDYSSIEAPMDGRMGRRLIDPGNLVQTGTTALADLQKVDQVYAYFNVSDSDVLRLLSLQDQYGGEQGAPISLSLDGKEFPYQGTIDWTALGVDPNTRTQVRRGIFDNADGRLLSGLFVRVRLQIADNEEKVLIEERAIASDQRGDYVLVLAPEGEPLKDASGKEVLDPAGNPILTYKVEYRPVVLGISVEGKRVIESGLTTQDCIVVNGLQKARPGSFVTKSKTSPTSPPTQGVVPAADSGTQGASEAGAQTSPGAPIGQPNAGTEDAAGGSSSAPVAPPGGSRTSPSPAGPSQLQESDDAGTRSGG